MRRSTTELYKRLGIEAEVMPKSRGILSKRVAAVVARGEAEIARTPLPQANAYAMIQRRARAAGIRTRIGKRIGFKRAAVAVARKLAVVMHAMLRSGQLFERTAGGAA